MSDFSLTLFTSLLDSLRLCCEFFSYHGLHGLDLVFVGFNLRNLESSHRFVLLESLKANTRVDLHLPVPASYSLPLLLDPL